MILQYILKQEVDQPYIYTEIPIERQNWFCCQVMKDHVGNQETFYLLHEEHRLEVESYDHPTLIIKFCFNCGQKVEIKCIGKQMMKRDGYGVLNVPVGGLIQI